MAGYETAAAAGGGGWALHCLGGRWGGSIQSGIRTGQACGSRQLNPVLAQSHHLHVRGTLHACCVLLHPLPWRLMITNLVSRYAPVPGGGGA